VVGAFKFRIDTPLAKGLQELVARLDALLGLQEPIRMFIAGGMAVHLYTGTRVTTDVDAEFSKRLLIPADLVIQIEGERILYLDTNYNSTFALMHEDYLHDAIEVPIGAASIQVFVLSPVDLIVSKIARLAGPDREDIASIVKTCGVSADDIAQRADQALAAYVGNPSAVRLNLFEVLTLARATT
jgi:hypothetical protein